MVRCSIPACAALGFALSACTPKANVGDLETDSASGSGESGSDEGESNSGQSMVGTNSNSGTGSETGEPFEPNPSSKVDVLFIIDNSGSMGEEQGATAAQIDNMVELFDTIGLEYRIAVTTSDNGNLWCSGTSPEGGAFRMSSCREREAEFIFQGAQTVDRLQEGCQDHCNLDTITILPTTTQGDPNPNPRPWVERFADGSSNVGDGASISEALACALPQGINGCGFEQPLESMYKAVERADIFVEDQNDFFRDDAHAVFIFITDEVDCSYNNDHGIIFLPEGNRVFWSLPEEGSPTSALCWNAGVQCEGSSPYSSCEPADLDVNGNPAANPDSDAVLLPADRYRDRLLSLRQEKVAGDIFVYSISGSTVTGEIVYQDAPGGSPNDPNYQDNFGIGPGCTSSAAEAVPPVRMRWLVDELNFAGVQRLFSICDVDQTSAFSGIASELADASL